MKLRIFKQKRNAFLRKHTLTYPSGWPMMILLYMGVYEMGKRKNEYIFAPEKQKTGRLGCLATVLAMIVALVLATFLLNHAANSRVSLLSERCLLYTSRCV